MKRLALALALVGEGVIAAETGTRNFLDEIRAPRVVATQPNFAVRDLCRTADGEIRHYGWQGVSGYGRRRIYLASRDNGITWSAHVAPKGAAEAMVQSPWSGDWIYFGHDWESLKFCIIRSKVGPGDPHPERTPLDWRNHELRQIFPMTTRKRWIASFSDTQCIDGDCYRATVAYSDDDGRTWTRVRIPQVKDVPRLHPGDRRPHWFNDGCEPSVVELRDGSLLMAVRTSGEHHAFFTSKDGGETWGEGKEHPAFWAANTMPYLFRLSDGRLLFFWNNTAMLPTRNLEETPELDGGERTGQWEAVFTNRDALHAAISEDDGKTWRGFREIALTESRNAADFRELGPGEEYDKSVHQTQALELPNGKVLLAYGQNSAARRLAIFSPDWLLDTARKEDFRSGLGNVSNHLYVRSLSGGFRGWAGHCAWNRVAGALLVRDPDTDDPPPGQARSVREVLQLARVKDPRLVSDRQGVVWNFPAMTQGRVSLNCRIDGAGFRLTLADHWMNPCDEVGPSRSPLSLSITSAELSGGDWHDLAVEWDEPAGLATVSVDGKTVRTAALAARSAFGLSYLHLQTLAETTDPSGAYFRSFAAQAKRIEPPPAGKPLAGVLRWDAWDSPDADSMTRVVEKTLGRPEYHWRLPWFADVHADGTVSINAAKPEVMEQEIDFAANAGLDYFIFLNYGTKSHKSAAFDRYLAAPNSDRMRFALCFMFIKSQISDEQWPSDVEHYVRYFKDPRCVKVCGGRPLVFTFHYGDLTVNRRIRDLKEAAARLGLDPYFAFFNNTPDAMWPMMKELGYDAIGMYATAKAAASGPCSFYTFATNMESRVRGPALRDGIPCIPSVQTGWDKSPRQKYVPYWEKDELYHRQKGFPDFPTPDELADAVRRGQAFVKEHPEVCPANTYSIYSWNEFDEGGWLCPTWTPNGADASRLKAVRGALKGTSELDRIAQRTRETFIGQEDCFQCERLIKRMEQAKRLESLPGRTMLMQAELDDFTSYFNEALDLWKVDPANPSVKPVEVDVADFGAKGDGVTDNAPAFCRAVSAVRALGGRPSILRIGAGEYHFDTPAAKTDEKYVVNVDFSCLTNCLISGAGPCKTHFSFGVYDAHGLSLRQSRNLTISGIECRWRETPFSETTVVSYDPESCSAVVNVHPLGLKPDDPRFAYDKLAMVCCVFDKDGNKVNRGGVPFVCRNPEPMENGRYLVRFDPTRGNAKDFRPLKGDVVIIPNRRNEWSGTFALKSEFCNFSHVWFRNARAAAINPANCHYATAVYCRTFPAEGFSFSSNADTFYNARGSYLAHCEFDHQGDDGANSLSYGMPVRSQDGPRELSVRAFWGRLRVGDVVQIMDAMSGRFRAELRVAAIERYKSDAQEPMVRMTFDRDLPAGIVTVAQVGKLDAKTRYAISHGLGEVKGVADLLYAPLQFGTGFTVFDCRIHDLRGCGINVQCPHALIESNVIERIVTGMKMTGLTEWFEGTPPYDVVIRNNVFRENKFGIRSQFNNVNARISVENPIRWVEIVSNRFEKVEMPFQLNNLSDEVVRDNER